ncbi:MAG TPA: signal peptidase II [Candidatus Peribacteraceae bacterium]|nr:signal peptidase II [Candidatus Peribacteraceae bacterium]
MHFLLTVLLGFLGSLGAKWLADTFLTERIPVLGSMAGLQPAFNSGIAFGINLPYQDAIIFVALILVCIAAWRSAKIKLSGIGFGLIVGGAFANIVDRFQDGLVTDFFQVGTFPIFNVADSCITIGVILLLLEILLEKRTIKRVES